MTTEELRKEKKKKGILLEFKSSLFDLGGQLELFSTLVQFFDHDQGVRLKHGEIDRGIDRACKRQR